MPIRLNRAAFAVAALSLGAALSGSDGRSLALSGAGAGDFRALYRLGAESAAHPHSSTTVSGPLSGKAVAQLLTQTS